MKKGQIDQVITNVIVVVAVFFLMFIFVVGSSNIGAFKEKSLDAQKYYPYNERALLEVFLLEELDNGMSVIETFREISKTNIENKIILGKMIEDSFNEIYSCNGDNKMAFFVNDDSNIGPGRLESEQQDEDLFFAINALDTSGGEDFARKGIYVKRLEGLGTYVAVSGGRIC